jgi:CubicO group peptidase (beta-lactamase class C family)
MNATHADETAGWTALGAPAPSPASPPTRHGGEGAVVPSGRHPCRPIELNRRSFLLQTLVGTAGLAGFAFADDQTTGKGVAPTPGRFRPEELQAMQATAAAFMTKHKVPGLSVAIAKEGRLVYAEGYGFADKEKNETVTPRHLFRIASVTKPITSVAIFRLIEAGKLRLSDKVFGPNAILGTAYGEPPYQRFVEDITVEHLLTHTAGGWRNDGRDPMFSHPRMDHQELITWTIAHQPLSDPPGEKYAYSNFGYCILGRVIEKLTGKPYPQAVGELVFAPCGITGMRLGGNTRAERAPSEVIYYDQNGGDPYGMNVRRMDSHGGWLATPTDLVRFLVRVDGFPTKPDILKPETIKTMTTPPAASPGYAKGWAVNKYNNWWHMGSLPGTITVMVRTSGQFCWAALTNTRNANSSMGADLDHLIWDMVGKIKQWPEDDLFRAGS